MSKIHFSFSLLIFCTLQGCTQKEVNLLLQNSINNMVFVQGGTFKMGQVFFAGRSLNGYGSPVALSNFYISKDNVSYGEFDIYTKATYQPYIDQQLKKFNYFARGANYPVSDATWYQAHDYCAWLAQKTGLPYALPTEVQWEYAARNRGNSNWAFPTNDGTQKLGVNFPSDQQLAHQNPVQQQGEFDPMPVGSIPCTPMGVCGMAGQVNEWVNNWYDPNYYHSAPFQDPPGANTGTLKIIRGGGPGSSGQNNTFGKAADDPNDPHAGFRCVINSTISPKQLTVFAPGYPK